MFKKLISIFALSSLWVLPASANVVCEGIPTAIYAGVHGPGANGSTYWANLPEHGLVPLGLIGDNIADARFSMALAAYAAKKKLHLQYYSETSCVNARANITSPTYAAITD